MVAFEVSVGLSTLGAELVLFPIAIAWTAIYVPGLFFVMVILTSSSGAWIPLAMHFFGVCRWMPSSLGVCLVPTGPVLSCVIYGFSSASLTTVSPPTFTDG